MNRALLIDDEPPARDILRALLADHPAITIAAEAGTLQTARTALARDDYDLVFLDIQLRGGTGFDLVPHVRPGARIIFVTAYDQHALRAFQVNALDYLLKPVDPARLAESLRRVASPSAVDHQRATPSSSLVAPDAPLASPPPPLNVADRVLVKLGAGNERFLPLADIRTISSAENYSELLVGADGERLFVRKTMKAWEEILPAAQFVRVHRQTIVNVQHVRDVDRVSEATLHLRVHGLTEPVHASYRYLADLRRALGLR